MQVSGVSVSVSWIIRKNKKHGGRAAPFFYCGEVDFESWHGEKPITVKWRLRESVPEHFHTVLGVSE